jgi:hypothetical protein
MMSDSAPLQRLVSWPRGRFNGRRITGFELKFGFDVLHPCWKPMIHWNFGSPVLWWLWFYVRAEARYE